MRQRIAIAGASGFVGSALIGALHDDYDVIALSRTARESGRASVQWRACNLFNLRHTENALAGADIAVYLVHSMMPTARLAQGDFADLDLICADNFARAAKSCGVKHLVYLSGLMPSEGRLSRHLQSRREVEDALGAHGTPLITLRAGIVLGGRGSSFQILARLVRRLPVMIAPSWATSRTQPVALDQVVELLRYSVAHPELAGRSYDVGCSETLSYRDMLRRAAANMGRRVRILTLPLRLPRISLLWVSVITRMPRQLVMPLLESLQHDMIAHDGLALQKQAGIAPRPFDEAMAQALREEQALRGKKGGRRSKVIGRAPLRGVLSVQRFVLPKNRSAEWVASEYARWLPQFLWPFLRVSVTDARNYSFYLPLSRRPALELTFAPSRSTPDRQLFYITGGWLTNVAAGEAGRFEFRSIANQTHILAAIHDYVPRLPWYVYVVSQAFVHLVVMRAFGRHLRRQSTS